MIAGLGFLLPGMAWAHGSGPALQKVVNGYQIDVHYPFVMQAGVPIWLNFFLSKKDEGIPAEFTDLDVSVMKDKSVMLKTNITKKLGKGTGAVMTFPNPGTYRIYLTYNNGKDTVVETYFDTEVHAPPASLTANIVGILLNKELLIGLLFGFASPLLFKKYKELTKEYGPW